MAEEHRGFSGPDEIETRQDAVDFLGVDYDTTEEEAERKYRELAPILLLESLLEERSKW